MNNDRELLQLAAKAIGHGLEWVSVKHDDEPEPRLVTKNPYWFNWPKWNPLTDDGDALRLAVKLNLVHGKIFARGVAESHDDGGDIYGAVRRAIVRAAAEIGRGVV